jgi:uncharacterized membrane protein YjgN (DUF898 family)
MVPWSMTELWNSRWNKMSFGQHPFEAGADTEGLLKRWLLIYAVPLAMVFIGLFGLGALVGGGPGAGAGAGIVLLAVLFFYVGILLASLSYYAAYYRKVVSATSWGGIEFYFTARTKDWLKLILGSIGLVIVTLGFGALFIGYRNWSFAIRHLEASGEINLDSLLQSSVAAPREAEGFADAFDIGAI